MAAHDLTNNGKTKSGARGTRVYFPEALKNQFLFAAANSLTLIADFDRPTALRMGRRLERDGHDSAAVNECVLEQIAHHVAKVVSTPVHRCRIG